MEDQAFILQRILQICDEEAVDALLVSADIYDRLLPSQEALALLDHRRLDFWPQTADADFRKQSPINTE